MIGQVAQLCKSHLRGDEGTQLTVLTDVRSQAACTESVFIKLRGDLGKAKYWITMNLPPFAFLLVYHKRCYLGIYGMQSPLLTTFLRDPGFCQLCLSAFRLGHP